MIRILADSNFFIGLLNPQDSLHSQALSKSVEIQAAQNDIVISNFVFSEIVTVLSRRVGRIEAVREGNNILKGQAEIIFIDEELQKSSWKIFEDVRKKNVSFVDCSSIAVMQAEGIDKFLTFDKEDFSNLRKIYGFSFY